MTRNLDRRVELLFPIENPSLRKHIVDNILIPYIKDNAQGRQLQSNGTYSRIDHSQGTSACHVQDWFVSQAKGKVIKS